MLPILFLFIPKLCQNLFILSLLSIISILNRFFHSISYYYISKNFPVLNVTVPPILCECKFILLVQTVVHRHVYKDMVWTITKPNHMVWIFKILTTLHSTYLVLYTQYSIFSTTITGPQQQQRPHHSTPLWIFSLNYLIIHERPKNIVFNDKFC